MLCKLSITFHDLNVEQKSYHYKCIFISLWNLTRIHSLSHTITMSIKLVFVENRSTSVRMSLTHRFLFIFKEIYYNNALDSKIRIASCLPQGKTCHDFDDITSLYYSNIWKEFLLNITEWDSTIIKNYAQKIDQTVISILLVVIGEHVTDR